MENFKNSTFLGGTCNESTWREELIAQLDERVEFFNPVALTGHLSVRQERTKLGKNPAMYCLLSHRR